MADDSGQAKPQQEHIERAITRLGALGIQIKREPGGYYLLYLPHNTGAEIGIEISYLIAQLAHPQYLLGAVVFANTSDEPFIPLKQRAADWRENYPDYIKYGIYPANSGGT